MRAIAVILLVASLVAVLGLTASLPAIYVMSTTTARVHRAAVADACVATVSASRAKGEPLAPVLSGLKTRYALDRIDLHASRLPAQRDANDEWRPLGDQVLVLRFRNDFQRQFQAMIQIAVFAALSAIIGLAGAIGSTTLTRRSEETAPAGQWRNLFDTVETSIRTLRLRENKLAQLHAQERDRAEELDAISSTLVRSLSSGFLSLDENGVLVDMNVQARDLLSPEGDPAGLRPADAFPRRAFGNVLQNASDERAAITRRQIREDDGTTIELTTAPLVDHTDRYIGMIAIFSDLTPALKIEGRLREVQALADLGEMAAGIAHEFRNSLSTITGYLRLAQRSELPPGVAQSLARAEQEGKELSLAVDSLLGFARPIPLQMADLDLAELVESALERTLRNADGLEIRTRIEPVRIQGDSALLFRAIENILRNARESVAEKGGGGVIEVSVEATPPRVVVTDSGVGFEPKDAGKLFLPFRSTKPKGHGLGLSLARKIILVHGGEISLQGTPALGATVVIHFPPH